MYLTFNIQIAAWKKKIDVFINPLKSYLKDFSNVLDVYIVTCLYTIYHHKEYCDECKNVSMV